MLLVVFSILFKLMMKGFTNPERKHRMTPGNFNIDFEEVLIPTKNNCTLYGWWLFNDKELPAIILVHGWGRNVERMMPYIQKIYGDFNLLAFDSRTHGNSDKDKYSTMVKFAEDISASVDFLFDESKISNNEIGVIGLSVGGAAAVYAASNDRRIKSLVTIGAFANPMDVMKMHLKKRHVPYYPIGWLLLNYLQFRIGFRFNEVAPEKKFDSIDYPVLIIHGEADETIPVAHADRLYSSSIKENTELWKIPNMGHSDCHKAAGFWERIRLFFNAKNGKKQQAKPDQ